MNIYLRGFMLCSLFTLPALADTSIVIQNLKEVIPVKSKSNDIHVPQREVHVIAVLTSEDAKVSFMHSLDATQRNFRIKKSFPLVGPKKKKEEINTSETPVRRQVLVISSATLGLDELIATIEKIPGVESVTEDKVVQACEVEPDDPKFDKLWGLENDNDPITDINVTEAWNFSTGSEEVVIGIIDTGVDYTHSDLSANIWTNTDELYGIAGEDDDGNGYIDDIYGIDTANDDSDPMDDYMHGTHVAGTIGAVGDNGTGITGVNWKVKIASCKFLDASGTGFTSDAVECVNYFNALKQQGVNIVALNNSWGGESSDGTLEEAIQTANSQNILFVAAAGNGGQDNDETPFYPAGYDVANVVSVAASDSNGDLAYFTNYGATSVDLAAPGIEILSTVPATCVPDTILPTEYFREDFENGTEQWEFLTYDTTDAAETDIPSEHWQIEDSLLSNKSLSDSPGGEYKNNRVQIAHIKNTLDLSGANTTADRGVCLTLNVTGETETNWDTLNVLLSKDGEHWYTLRSISGDLGIGWQTFSLSIPEEYLVSDLHIVLYRFNDSSIVKEGYNIDDISVTSGTIERNNYDYHSGTSMATPHVSGAIALLASIDNNLNASTRKQLLFDNVTHKSDYETKIATSGLLNAGTMLSKVEESPANSDDSTSGGGGGGGGCTYNPNLKKFDAMFFLILILSLFYPWRRKLIK